MRVLLAGLVGGTNGIETYTRAIAHGLTKEGHEIILCQRDEVEPSPELESVSSVSLPGRNWALRRVIGPFESIRVHRPLRRLAQSLRADVLHVTYPEFAPRSDIPTVATGWHPYTGPVGRIRTARARSVSWRIEGMFALSDVIAFRRADAVAAISQPVERALRAGGLSAYWIPPCIQDELIRPVVRQRPHDCALVARWLDHPIKGLPLAIDAVRRVREAVGDARLVLVGEFLRPATKSALPDFCIVRGLVGPNDVRQILSSAGCCVIPSVFEEFGYAALEALAAGAPVVSGALPGFEGFETDGLMRVRTRDAREFADAILRAFDVDSFDFPAAARASTVAAKLTALYEAAINGHDPSHEVRGSRKRQTDTRV